MTVLIGVMIDRAVTTGDLGELLLWVVILCLHFLVLSLSYRFGARIGNRAVHVESHRLRTEVSGHVLLADPVAVVLDEATAEAGSSGARNLERAALAVTSGRTSLVIAHRLTQAESADRIVVMEQGRIVETGTHAELVAGEGRYSRLWSAWRGL